MQFSLSILKTDDISPLKHQLTAISSIVKKNDCVVFVLKQEMENPSFIGCALKLEGMN